MLIGKPYEPPPATFKAGTKVEFFLSDDSDEHGKVYRVVESDHCWSWIEGHQYQISNWRLRRVHKGRQKSTGEPLKRDRSDRVTIDSKNLLASEKPLKDTRP